MYKLISVIKQLLRELLFLFSESKEERKIRTDYEYLIRHGVDTKPGYVTLYGKPIIIKHPNSKIIIGENVKLISSSLFNPAGVNHPVIIATLADNASISIGNGCGFSGTSIVCVRKVSIGNHSRFGVNTNIYDTDFHVVGFEGRKIQKDICEAKSEPVKIGDDVWIGASTTILKGIEIGKAAIVGAHSLVIKNIGDFELHGGNPATYIKMLNEKGK